VARLQHPNIVQITRSAATRVCRYCALDTVPAASLDAVLAGTRCRPARRPDSAKPCPAAAHAHAAGIVHRDLKPANVLLQLPTRASRVVAFRSPTILWPHRGGPTANGIPKITDFGLARKTGRLLYADAQRRGSWARRVHGTEQRGEKVGTAADVVRRGRHPLRIADGRPPFKAPTCSTPCACEGAEPADLCSRADSPRAADLGNIILCESLEKRNTPGLTPPNRPDLRPLSAHETDSDARPGVRRSQCNRPVGSSVLWLAMVGAPRLPFQLSARCKAQAPHSRYPLSLPPR